MLFLAAETVLCWNCDSKTNPGCGDPWYKTYNMVNVDCRTASCAKIRSKELIDGA